MRSMLPASFLLTVHASALGGTSNPEDWWQRCGGPFNLCGYVENGSEEPRIPKQYEVAKKFSDGLAAVRIDGRYGYIDPTGKVVIAPQFEAAGPFTGDYAEVRIDGRSGAIDRTGRIVVPAQFDRLVPFTGGAFIARPLRPGAQRSSENPRLDGEIWLEGLRDALIGLSGGIYHIEKGWLTPGDLQFSYFDDPDRGLIWAGRRNEHHDEHWGLVRADGTWQVTPRYSHVQRLSETHAVVASMPDYSLDRREWRYSTLRGAVDRDGKLVVPMERRGLSYWRGGYGLASEPRDPEESSSGGPDEKRRSGMIQADGSLLAGQWFDEVDIRQDGKLPRGRIGRTWYSIERDGSLVTDQLEGTAYIECPNGLRFVHRGNMLEVQRPGDGKPTGEVEKSILRQVDCPGPFASKRNGKWFLILEDGSVLGGRTGFDNTYSFSPNYAAVEVAGKWGIIDRTGAFTVKPKFRKLHPAAKDKFVVGEGKKSAWIDGKGRWIKAPGIPKRSPTEALACQGGLRFFSADGLWGLQDGDGKTLIEPKYRALTCFWQGVSWAAAPGDKEWCPIGPKGERREAMKCRESHYPMIVTHHYPESFSDDRHESSVLWSRALLDYKAGTRSEPPKWISDGARGDVSYSVIPN